MFASRDDRDDYIGQCVDDAKCSSVLANAGSFLEVLTRSFADRLLAAARVRPVPERVALMLTGRYVPAASALWEASTIGERLRAMAHVGREPSRWRRYRRLLNDHADEWRFLREGWVAEALAVWSDETA